MNKRKEFQTALLASLTRKSSINEKPNTKSVFDYDVMEIPGSMIIRGAVQFNWKDILIFKTGNINDQASRKQKHPIVIEAKEGLEQNIKHPPSEYTLNEDLRGLFLALSLKELGQLNR